MAEFGTNAKGAVQAISGQCCDQTADDRLRDVVATQKVERS